MAGPCPTDFASMADELGPGSCADVRPVVNVRNPLDLANWTLPVVELLLVSLAIAAAAQAVRRWRAGDVTPGALWLGSVVYLMAMEPPVYFPAQFRKVEDHLKTAFVHNVFTVEFMFDRMPLYILCLYPAMAVLELRGCAEFRCIPPTRAARRINVCRVRTPPLLRGLRSSWPAMKWWAWNPEEKISRR